jgi:inner membrane protein
MASFGHVAVGMFAGRIWMPRTARWRELFAAFVIGATLAMLPDADVVAFAAHIPYAAPWGHRGAAHSFVVALAGAVVIGLVALRWLSAKTAAKAAALAFAVLLSHGLLDTLTDGGLGVALLWPFDTTRYFAPWQPIPVAPIGAGMLSRRGLYCLLVELGMFAPFWLAALLWRRPRHESSR